MPQRVITYSRRWFGEFWYLHLIAAGFAFSMLPLIMMAFDRTPPFIRLAEGSRVVSQSVPPGGDPKLQYVAVQYVATRPIRSEEDCPGVVQQEFLDNEGNFASKYARQTGPAKWEEHPTDPSLVIFTGRPISVPANITGSSFVLTTNTFRYCNFVQQFLRWPIVQSGPDLVFTQPKGKTP